VLVLIANGVWWLRYGTRFTPGWTTVSLVAVPDGDSEGYTWSLLLDNLTVRTSYIVRCRVNDGSGSFGQWSFKSKPMSTTKTAASALKK
jgi:hypothetical protein